MLRHGNKPPDSLMLRAEVPQISVAKAVVRHWSCFLYHSLLVQRDFQTQKGKALPSRLQLTKKHHAGTCSLPLAVHSGVVEANEQSPFMSPLWLSSLYETLTAGRKIQLAEVFQFSLSCMHACCCEQCEPKETRDCLLLKPLSLKFASLATVPSTATNASCCMLTWWDLQPFSAIQQSPAHAGEAGVYFHLRIHYSLLSLTDVYSRAFKGFNSFFSNHCFDPGLKKYVFKLSAFVWVSVS